MERQCERDRERERETGKSFLLTTVFLWCIVNGYKTRAAAPTGIAAANVEIEGTDVAAMTVHAMFDLDTEWKSKLDFSKLGHSKVDALMALQVLLLDEAPAFFFFACVCGAHFVKFDARTTHRTS